MRLITESAVLIPAGLLLGGWLLLRWRSRRPHLAVVEAGVDARKVVLAELMAVAQKRVLAMQDCRITLLSLGSADGQQSACAPCATRQMPGRWICLSLQVEPPSPETRWWPCGLSVECPEFLVLRDSLPAGEVSTDYLAARNRVLYLHLETIVDGHPLVGSLRGPHSISLVVYVPFQCRALEIGYYGNPSIRHCLEMPNPGRA